MLILRTLGRIELEQDGATKLAGRRKPLALLAYLARRRGRASTRDELADLLWGDAAGDESLARKSLRQALSELRAAVGDALVTDEQNVRLSPDSFELDANALEADVASKRWHDATLRWHGDFLLGLDDLGGERWREWLEGERPSLRQMAARAFERLVDEGSERGDWTAAVQAGQRWHGAFPGDEQACVRLVRSLRAAGHMAEASAAHAECIATLRRDFGIEPSAELLGAAEGLERPHRARVGTPGARALMTPDLVGRGEALASLSRVWQRVATEGRVVIVRGDEGVGKSRLLQEWARQVRTGRPRSNVVEARAYAGERGQPFATLRPLMMQLADLPGLAGVSPDVLASLATVAPELRDVFRHLPSVSDSPALDVGEPLRRALSELSAERPLLLVLDDAPESDAASAGALAPLLRRPPKGLMLLLSGRTDAWATSPFAADVERPSHVDRVTLAALEAADSLAMLASMVPLAPEAARTLAERLHRESGGNPAQLAQLLAHLAAEGHLAPDATGRWSLTTPLDPASVPLPAGLRDAFMSRLRALTPSARALAEVAAVAGGGPHADASTLERLSGLDAESFASAVGDVLVGRVLIERGGHDGWRGFEFQSEANRRAVYESIAPSRRRDLHRAMYRVLRAATEGGRAESDAAEYHRRLSGDARWLSGRRVAAITAAAVAALVASGAFLRTRAAAVEPGSLALLADVHNLTGDSLFARALYSAATVQLQQSRQIALVPPSRIAQALVRMRRQADTALGEALAREVAEREGVPMVIALGIARFDSAYELTARLVEPRSGRDLRTDREVAPHRADVLGALDRLLDRTRRTLGESRASVAASEGYLPRVTTASLEALRAYAEGARAWARRDYATARDEWLRAVQLDSGFALAWSSLADYSYTQTADRHLRDEYLNRALAGLDRLTEREQLILKVKEQAYRGSAEEAIRLAGALAERFPERETWYNYGSSLMRARRCDEAVPALRHALQLDSLFTNAWINLATCEQFVGRYADAVKSYERASAGDSLALARGSINHEYGMALVHLGLLDSAESVYRRLASRQSPDERRGGVRSLALVHTLRGRYAGAEAELDTAVELSRQLEQYSSVFRGAVLLAQAANMAGHPVRARAALETAWSTFRQHLVDVDIGYFGSLEFAKAGQAARAQSMLDTVKAQAPSSSAGRKSMEAVLGARIALATGHPERAREALKLATDTTRDGYRYSALVDTYEALGMTDSALTAAEELARIMRVGDEQQDEWLGAPLRVARLAQKLGDVAKSRAAYALILDRWKDGDPGLPAIVEAKRAIAMPGNDRPPSHIVTGGKKPARR